MTPYQIGLLLTLVISVILPVLVGLVTTTNVAPGWRAVLLATLAFASAFLTQWLVAVNGDVPFDVFTTVVTGFGAWVIAVATHFGLWKPTGVSARVLAVGSPTPPVQHAAALTPPRQDDDPGRAWR